jgi:hypothetical protein
VSRLHPAIALDDLSGDLDRPRRPKGKRTKRERQLAWLRRQEAEARAARERRQARRALDREPTLEPLTGALPAHDPWGPAVRMGRTLRVQAAVGHRAAVIELKPGLFLVAEVPEAALRPEFGFIPLLAPMIMNAATSAIGPITQAVQAAQQNRQARPARPLVPTRRPALRRPPRRSRCPVRLRPRPPSCPPRRCSAGRTTCSSPRRSAATSAVAGVADEHLGHHQGPLVLGLEGAVRPGHPPVRERGRGEPRPPTRTRPPPSRPSWPRAARRSTA